MKNRLRILIPVCMIIGMVLCGRYSFGFADADMRRVVVGADLSEEQINSVYGSFGIQRGEVPELRLTNAEEHAALDGFLDTVPPELHRGRRANLQAPLRSLRQAH